MSEVYEFQVEPRQTGKHYNRKARTERKVPTVVYGPKTKNFDILMEENSVKKYSSPRFESTIFSLKSDDKTINNTQVLIKNIQYHPVTDRPVHVDLYAVDMTSAVRVNVVINYEGTPVGVKEEGGLLQTVLNELEVECLPTKIPDAISIDITGMKLNDSLHVSDIPLPEDVKAITSESRTICTVSAPKEEATAEPAAEGDDAAPAEGDAAADAKPADGNGEKS